MLFLFVLLDFYFFIFNLELPNNWIIMNFSEISIFGFGNFELINQLLINV